MNWIKLLYSFKAGAVVVVIVW